MKVLWLENYGDVDYNEEEFLNLGANFEEAPNEIKTFNGKSELHIIDVKQEENEEEEESTKDYVEDNIKLTNIELEAEFVSKKINELISEGYMVQTKKGYKKLEYRDIVILLRATNNTSDIFEKALVKKEIPVFSDCGGSYLETPEL